MTPPVIRFDANNYSFDIQRDGSLRNGIDLRSVPQAACSWMSSPPACPCGSKGRRLPRSRTAGVKSHSAQQGLAGLNVTRKVFVPRSGYFARYLDVFSNPTAQPITVDVRVSSQLQHTQLVKTSSGDAALDVGDAETADRWIVLDDATDAETGVPATAIRVRRPRRRRAHRQRPRCRRTAARRRVRVADASPCPRMAPRPICTSSRSRPAGRRRRHRRNGSSSCRPKRSMA